MSALADRKGPKSNDRISLVARCRISLHCVKNNQGLNPKLNHPDVVAIHREIPMPSINGLEDAYDADLREGDRWHMVSQEDREHHDLSIVSDDNVSSLVLALRRGDERAFAVLVDRYHQSMLRVAVGFVGSPAVAEEVVQETWLGVLRGIDQFAGRSSLKTWLFRILVNQAKRRGAREGRSISFSAMDDSQFRPAVEEERFLPSNAAWSGHWAGHLADWRQLPETELLSIETREQVRRAIDRLPTSQRMVIFLRDIEGWTAGEVCELMSLSETNQRVRLHRARSYVRHELERYFEEA